MEIWLQDLSDRANYTRFGKVIPKKETKVDMIKYFGRDVLKELKADRLIKVIVHNASNLAEEKKQAEIKIEEAPVVMKAEEIRRDEIGKKRGRPKA